MPPQSLRWWSGECHGARLAVLRMEVSVSRCGFASRVWKRLVHVSFLRFSSFARGGGAPLWCCVAGVRIVATFWWSHLPWSCF
ncbi:hypothetical protein Taro_049587 [Colocasia esculenta]|uniref:Uncharacterized protein n=1 Tax=Colocasia esculenta TaxID=4460 RepID=A0A843XBF8_COLES|nr:hypothetical protein [Colocasia esculenta]